MIIRPFKVSSNLDVVPFAEFFIFRAFQAGPRPIQWQNRQWKEQNHIMTVSWWAITGRFNEVLCGKVLICEAGWPGWWN